MAQTLNLNSKLKILVAKLFKAEKLYHSMKNTAEAAKSSVSKNSKSSNSYFQSTILLEHANEVRANEWHRVHQDYRIKLNDILSELPANKLANGLNEIWQSFISEFKSAEYDIKSSKSLAEESIEREEYAQLLKISTDLVRKKARLQALKVINDELNLLISQEKRNESIQINLASLDNISASNNNAINTATTNINSNTENVKSNLIPLKRRVI